MIAFRFCSLLLAVALVAGCSPALPTGTGTPRRAENTPAGTASGVAETPPTNPVTLPPVNVGPAAPLVSNNGGSLVGVVKAPAALIGNNGGGLIGNNGGGYRLLSLAQQPLAGATVRLLDAAGQAVVGPDGQPLVTTTDAQGQYGFTAALPPQHLLVEVALPGDKGTLQAIAARPEGATQRQVEVELVSTLTTTYILDQYVKTQKDPVLTLEKLPTDVEAATRQKAASALEAGSVATPDALTPAKVVETVAQLRAKDAGFDAQMETVKKLLIAAGQSDLGSGRPGTEVSLGYAQSLAVAADGSLYIACSGDRRVWKLRTDGRIETAAGSGSPDTSANAINGKLGPAAGLVSPEGLAFTPSGQLLVLEAGYDDYPIKRLMTLAGDGTLKELWYDTQGVAAVAGSGDETLVFRFGILNRPSTLHSVKPDGTKQLVHEFSAADKVVVNQTERYGRDANGMIYLGSAGRYGANVGGTGEGPAVYRFDPAAKTLTRVMGKQADGLQGVSVDARGNVFYLDGARALKVRQPDGTTRQLMARYPEGKSLDLAGCALAADGTAYVVQDKARVYRIRDGAASLVAGTLGAVATTAENLAFKAPNGVAVAPNGAMYVADEEYHQIFKIRPDRTVEIVAGTGEEGFSGDGGPAKQAKLDMPLMLRLDAAGNLYVLDNQGYSTYRIRKITPQGIISTVYTASDRMISDMVVAPDGTIYLADYLSLDLFVEEVYIRQIAPDGTASVLVDKSAGFSNTLTLALARQNDLQFLFVLNAGSQVIYVEEPSGKLQLTTVGGGKGFMANDSAGFAVDKDLRFYFADQDNNVVIRWDPAAKSFKTIGGQGGTHFTGSGVDDSLSRPGYLTFDADGNLYVSDTGHKQIKRIPAGEL